MFKRLKIFAVCTFIIDFYIFSAIFYEKYVFFFFFTIDMIKLIKSNTI